jgi:CheY-like chemotaxis protein
MSRRTIVATVTATETSPILVVDDDTDLRETLGELLSEEGYDTRLFENGRRALEFLRAGERPKLILLDLMMPEMNGWQFREEQLKDADLRDIPVVVMTASRGFEGSPISAQEILYKPVGLGDLIDAVERNATR